MNDAERDWPLGGAGSRGRNARRVPRHHGHRRPRFAGRGSAQRTVPRHREGIRHRRDRRSGNREEHARRPARGAYRKQGKTVGIIAVDPTSPYSGGAILGDRIRMQGHAGDEGIFIRSMATRGFLGGLARATADVALLLDAAGKQIVLIETVGVGQDEIDIVRLADCTLVLLVPGLGDDVQSMKAGLMEIADIFVVNKAEREGADRLAQQVEAMLHLGAGRARMATARRAHDGQRRRRRAALAETIERFRAWSEQSGARKARDGGTLAPPAGGAAGRVFGDARAERR